MQCAMQCAVSGGHLARSPTAQLSSQAHVDAKADIHGHRRRSAGAAAPRHGASRNGAARIVAGGEQHQAIREALHGMKLGVRERLYKLNDVVVGWSTGIAARQPVGPACVLLAQDDARLRVLPNPHGTEKMVYMTTKRRICGKHAPAASIDGRAVMRML